MGFYEERGYTLQQAQWACAAEIEVWYGNKVLDVFDCSTALATPHRYYCSEADQLRMLNGRIGNAPIQLMCGPVPAQPDQDPEYTWITHTSAECGKVHTAYVQFSQAAAQTRATLMAQVNNATTIAQVDAAYEALQTA